MSISSKQIQRAIRDFENIISDLSYADYDNYQRIIKRFVLFAQKNDIINKIIQPLLTVQIDSSKIVIDHRNGWGTIKVPPDINEHIAFVLQLFFQFSEKDDHSLPNFALQFFPSDNFNISLSYMNERLVNPAMRELVNRINDFVEDEVEDKESIELSAIQVFNIESIVNRNGNIAIGQNININSVKNIDKLPDEFLKIILDRGYSYSDFEKVKYDIEQIKEELKKDNPSKDILSKAFEKIKTIGSKIFVEILVKLISKPIVTSIAATFL